MGVPFQEEVDTSNYFPGAEFEKILSGIESAIERGSSLITLTGMEGCGKSMLCRLICDQEEVRSVCFPRPVEAFGEVVATVAVELGVLNELQAAGAYPEDTIKSLVQALQGAEQPVLLVFDEAERIYPATLERIRRMIDQLLREGCRIHTLFSGRPAFLDLARQLDVMDFEKVEEYFYELPPLEEEEAAAYIYSVVEKELSNRDGSRDIFTLERVEKICAAAHGNLQAINRLAREAMKDSGDDSSFMTLLESVEEEVVRQEEPAFSAVLTDVGAGLASGSRAWLQQHRWTVLAGVIVVCLPLALWLFFAGGEKPATVTPPKLEPALTTSRISGEEAEEEFKKAEEMARHQPLLEANAPVPPRRGAEVKPAAVIKPHQIDKSVEGNPVGIVLDPDVVDDGQGQGEEESLDNGRPLSGGVAKPPVISPRYHKKVFKPAPQASPVVQSPDAAEPPVLSPRTVKRPQTEIPVLRPTGREKRRLVAPGSGMEAAARQNISPESLRIERLLQNRLVAGMGWQNGSRDRFFTIQLMILNSKAAVVTLKRLLSDERYRYLVSDLYLFSKGVNPQRLMVFYGEFRSRKQADSALKKLPPFLSRYHPYTLSVKSAMDKVHQ